MGIQGLIPLLEKSWKPVNISDFSGCTVAVDAYCWLHKGVYICAEKLARGEDCQAYVYYCMRFVSMLLAKNIKPILVFDGQHLPAKADTESKRRKLREQNRKKAAELMRLDKGKEALSLLRRSVDVTHKMALNLIKQCREINVDCIVAPYEADSQLAFLNLSGIAHLVITEDSDLLLFGCKRVLFKLDQNGGGLLIEQEKLYLSMNMQPEKFSLDRFRYMCILSGCDYLPSIPGVGLIKARQFITRSSDPDIYKSLSRLGSFMNVKVPPEYRDKFMDADCMFKYQPVYDPLSRRIIPLNNLPDPILPVLDIKLTSDQAYQLALGNIDPISLETMDDWDPNNQISSNHVSKNKIIKACHKSIWSKDYVPFEYKPNECALTQDIVENTRSKKSKIKKNAIRTSENELSKIKKTIPVTENDILSTLEEIYENEKLSDDKCIIEEKQELKNSLPEKNNEDCKIIENIFNSKVDNVNTEHKTTGFKNLTKRKCTVIDLEKQVVSGYFATQASISDTFFDKECINPFKCRKTTVVEDTDIKNNLNIHLNSNKCIEEINKSQGFETNKVTEINTDTLDTKSSNGIKNSFNWKTFSKNEVHDKKKYHTIVSSNNNSQNDNISINIDTKKNDNESDIDEGFCSQNTKSVDSDSNNSYVTPKQKTRLYPRTGLSKSTGKKNQTLLSKFGFKTNEQLKH